MGEMKRATAREEQELRERRYRSTLCIMAAIIAAVRLARDDVSRPSPRLFSVVADSVQLAKRIMEQVVR